MTRAVPPPNVVREAIRIARSSPCAKSKRGVVTFDWVGVREAAHNGPPRGFTCDGSDACRASCSKVAVHAEQRALLMDETVSEEEMLPREMLHVKVVSGALVPSGGPSCPDCSKLILESGIVAMWLYELRDGQPTWIRYEAAEFHRQTLIACGLHVSSVPTSTAGGDDARTKDGGA